MIDHSSGLSRRGISIPTLIGMSAVPMWSAIIALYRGVAEAFGPVGGAAIVFTLASIFAWAGTLPQGMPRLPRRYLLIGGALFAIYEISLALAVGFTNSREQALEVGMINYLWPSFTIALAIAMRQERADWRILPGLALSFAGVTWVASGEAGISLPRLIENVSSHPLPYALALSAALSWPAYTLFTRLHSGGTNGVPVFLTFSTIALWVYYGLSNEPALVYNLQGAIMALSFGILTALSYTAWNYGVSHGNLAVMATTSYFTPVLSVMVTSLIFDMNPSANFWIAALMVTGGSLICWLSTTRKG